MAGGGGGVIPSRLPQRADGEGRHGLRPEGCGPVDVVRAWAAAAVRVDVVGGECRRAMWPA